MSKHTLFLVHGMGRHQGTQWSAEVWKKLVECSERYPHFRTKNLEKYAEPAPVGYDEFIRNALDRWDAQTNTFGEFALSQGVSLDWLDGMSRDDAGFFWSHVVDVIIHRFFPHVSAQIRANVQLQIFREIEHKRAMNPRARFSLMAHSLGTSVAHDALAEMGAASRIGDNVNTFGSANFRFSSIHMIANVSRLLQTTPKAYESVVRPGPNSTQNRYCGQMYCYRHELDPITLPKPFDPVTWGNDFRLTNLSHYRGWNVHGWLHYLDSPRVHIPLIKSITMLGAITPKQERDAVNSYPRFGGNLQNLTIAQNKLTELASVAHGIDEGGGLKDNFKALCRMWTLLSELKNLTGSTWATLEESVT
jgi:hypothetical protein